MKLTVEIAGAAVAAAALCGLGAATATAATPNAVTSVAARPSANAPGHTRGQLRDEPPFYFKLTNKCSQPVTIYTYQGGDWDFTDGTPQLRTANAVIAPGATKDMWLNEHYSAVDAVGVGATGVGNLGLALTQDPLQDGAYAYQYNPGTTFEMSFTHTPNYGEFTISPPAAAK